MFQKWGWKGFCPQWRSSFCSLTRALAGRAGIASEGEQLKPCTVGGQAGRWGGALLSATAFLQATWSRLEHSITAWAEAYCPGLARTAGRFVWAWGEGGVIFKNCEQVTIELKRRIGTKNNMRSQARGSTQVSRSPYLPQ